MAELTFNAQWQGEFSKDDIFTLISIYITELACLDTKLYI